MGNPIYNQQFHSKWKNNSTCNTNRAPAIDTVNPVNITYQHNLKNCTNASCKNNTGPSKPHTKTLSLHNHPHTKGYINPTLKIAHFTPLTQEYNSKKYKIKPTNIQYMSTHLDPHLQPPRHIYNLHPDRLLWL